MSENAEVAVIKANIKPVNGRQVYWLISRKQLEHIVSEADINPIPLAPGYISGIAAWQGLAVPVIVLESFFNFKKARAGTSRKKVLVKTAVQSRSGLAARLMLDAHFEVNVRSLKSADCSPAGISREDLDLRGLKGAYEWEEDKLLIIPDLDRIARGRTER